MPTSAYTARERKPRRAPSAVPTRSAAKVWPVTGTGEPGTGTAIWAAMPVSAAPPSDQGRVDGVTVPDGGQQVGEDRAGTDGGGSSAHRDSAG